MANTPIVRCQKAPDKEKIVEKTDLSKRALPNRRRDLVPVQELLPLLDDVIMVIIIVTVVVELSLLLVGPVLAQVLLRSPFLLCVIYLERMKHCIKYKRLKI